MLLVFAIRVKTTELGSCSFITQELLPERPGRLGNEGWLISLKICTQSRDVDLCNMPKLQVQRSFLAEFWISAPQGRGPQRLIFSVILAAFQSLF